MIGYATLGTNDLEKSKAFYDKVLAPLGAKRTFGFERMQFWGGPERGAMVAVCGPYDGQTATASNGGMLALSAPSKAVVDQVHAAALAAGAVCEGPPGQRMDNFYGAYFRDPDGNKICAFNGL